MKPQWMAWIASGLIASVAFPAVAEPTHLAQLFPALSTVQLTSEQQTQLTTMSQQALPNIQKLLTPDQQAQFQTALSQGQSVRGAVQSLHLSISQRVQIMNQLRPLRSQIEAILTPEQRQQIQQNIRAL
jgi:periplasmic protein CpxP/Spy